jgi:metallophosphoesterase superfamily enzyme
LRFAEVLRCHRAETVICLGDRFHDGAAGKWIRDSASDERVWIAGNHDPATPPVPEGFRVPLIGRDRVVAVGHRG